MTSSPASADALAVGKTGKIQAQLRIALGAARVFVATHADRAASLLESLDRHLIMEKAEIVDASAELAVIEVHGPAASAALDAAKAAGALAAVPLDATGLGGGMIVGAQTLRAALIEAATRRRRPSSEEARGPRC